ncbi:MAG TPA: pyridoxamine 5'-phosphate oxidase family protein [Clostridia bacterium]
MSESRQNRDAILSKVESMLNAPEQTFVLSTLTEDGYPDAGLMGNICDKSLTEIYFTCQVGTRKTDEILKNPKSSVYFTADAVTVWLYGDATVTTEETVRRKIWNSRVLRIYPEGVDSPRLAVIRFVPGKLRFREKSVGYIEFDL